MKPIETTKKLGARIREIREGAALTQAGLGRMLGVSAATVSGWEKGDSGQKIIDFLHLCHALGKTPNEFLGVDDRAEVYATPAFEHRVINAIEMMMLENGLDNENAHKAALAVIQAATSEPMSSVDPIDSVRAIAGWLGRNLRKDKDLGRAFDLICELPEIQKIADVAPQEREDK